MPDTSMPDGTTMRFGIGQPVPRNEDPVLLTGKGRYTDDLALPGQLWCAIVRSQHAHGVIRGIDTAAARAMPGVRAVYTGADLEAAGYGTLRCTLPFTNADGTPMRAPERGALATDKVRYVGDPVACVIAETRAQARDAAEAVVVEVDPLPAVTEASAAAAPDAPALYDRPGGNVVLDFHYGDRAKVEAAFARAAHRVKIPLRNNRVVVAAMEPRSAIAEYDAATGRYTLHVGCQGVFGLRNQLAGDILKVPVEKVRVLTGNVGGSFGMKASAYPEYVCLFHAAKELGRPVKWTDERSGSFVSDQHGRDHEVVGELALDAEGRFLAVRLTAYANMGGYMATVAPLMGTGNFVKNVQSNYATPLIEVATKCVMTNTTPVSAYRGAGRPEGNYFMERLIEAAAVATGMSAIELRRRNHIRADAFPYKAASGSVYDSGDFTAVLDRALAAADWDGFPARRAEARRRGRLRGIGIGNYLEVTAPPAREMGGIRFNADGTVTIITGTLDYGQGHWTPFAQILSTELGVPFGAIRLVQGDSDLLVAGGGTGGSKSLMASGSAIIEASAKVIEKGRRAAAQMLEVAEADIEFGQGRFVVVGTDRGVGIMELAAALREGRVKGEGIPESLDVDHVFEAAPSAFPNGCHVAEVEIDPDTGVVEVVSYVSVNDFGTIVNPMLVEGQVHGGVTQGIGQALMERVVYDETGQLLTGSFMDYALPRAADLPPIGFASHPVPAKTNHLGAKGCGEAGCAGSLPAVMNAVIDALRPVGVARLDMPATPERVWRAIRAARRAA
ncbi:xanthine dehydrogenase family protein molybdopterin-binding subunit [Elioraea sp. Yellowstone]|jgi:carbon-monoxide dehydrogenase large subunit|uniref:xanthine dehydrogenase family protein molybdopterin-binding subunit n=1 Tax=Elioraea sp. Yellowstone TaxID=2592070 RepID=UPI0011534208|nr:xanthine dehydrogenase family protein molybdopterin-binding subunit [Elioraea sp. Yellowstone]TQF79751.1 xanthine dehydrogenase family protein molybdopterin-binding subunit [Elioraea sp. Yellowstone]